MANKWMSKLDKLEGAVNIGSYDPNNHCLHSQSPYLNWSFGNNDHGIPYGYSILLGGPAKSGKTFVALSFVAQLHKENPDAIAVMYNTEMRTELQITDKLLTMMGIDKDRFKVFDVATPDMIFDKIEKDLSAMCDDGMQLKLIIIDSIAGIHGRRMMNADTIMTQQIGDQAATLQDGLTRILPVLRKHRIAMIGNTHLRDEFDQLEIMRGNKHRLKAANAAKHFFEFFCMIERNRTKDGKKTLDGQEFLDETVTDAMGKGDVTGHKIRFKILDSSTGVMNRTGEFTLNFERGIINQYEEVFLMGVNTGVIKKPNNVTYQYGEQSFRGQGAILTAMRDDQSLQNKILKEVYEKDILTKKGEENEQQT